MGVSDTTIYSCVTSMKGRLIMQDVAMLVNCDTGAGTWISRPGVVISMHLKLTEGKRYETVVSTRRCSSSLGEMKIM